jgi:NAD(P)-dependent dehydrogenase (short-subunit alcohol dehydrogenase family)
MDNLKNRLASITGASRGLGKAVALALGRDGAELALVGRDEVKLKETASEAEQLGANASVFVVDVTREGEARFLCSENAGYITGTDIVIDGGWTAQ